MAALFDCPKCGTPLLSSFDVDNAFASYSALMMSLIARGGDSYALNVYRQNTGCPICGCTSPNYRGVPPDKPRKVLQCTRLLNEQETRFVEMHAKVHLTQDAGLNPSVRYSAEYAFAHSALRHFVLGPGSSILGHLIGLIGLLAPGRPNRAVSHLCQIVEDCTKEAIDPLSISISAFATRGGSCAVIRLPEPRNPGEAFMVAVATSVRVDELDKMNVEEFREYPHLFTLEKTSVPAKRPFPAMLCQWRSRDRDDYYNNTRKFFGWGPLPVASDFVDCVERIEVSGIWKD